MARSPRKIGEREFVEAIRAASPDSGRRVSIGIGDDAAVVAPPAGKVLLSTDTMVEGTHFKQAWLTPGQLGRRAVRVAVSDLAAMGGRLDYILLSLELPEAFAPGNAVELTRSVMKEAEELGGVLVGGNVARAGKLSVTVTVVGSMRGRVLTRTGARAGDQVWVSGYLGQAAAGRRLLRQGKTGGALVRAFRQPPLRLELGRRLAAIGSVSAMMDISDGLVVDLERLCRSSNVGARIERARLPLSRLLRASSARPWADALGGGEDYELVFTVRGPQATRRLGALSARLAVPLTAIGNVEGAGRGRRVRDSGGRALGRGGYLHF